MSVPVPVLELHDVTKNYPGQPPVIALSGGELHRLQRRAGRRDRPVRVAPRSRGPERWLAGQRPGDRHPLALSAGQLGWPGAGPAGKPDPVQRLHRQAAPVAGRHPGVQQPVGHVVNHAGVLGEEELLEYEPDPGGP